ncbi:MAG: HD-GYP domain-containing protein [Candidatus Eisenbacteria bacterium]
MPVEYTETAEAIARRTDSDADQFQPQAELHAGRTLISQMAAIERLLHIYKPNNTAIMQAGDSVLATIAVLLQGSPSIEMRFWRDCIFINGERIRCDVANFAAYKHLLSKAGRLEVEKIILEDGLSRDDVVDFFFLLSALEKEGATGPTVADRVASEGLNRIGIVPSTQSAKDLQDLGISALTHEERAKRAFYAALGSTKEVMMAQTSQGAVSIRKARRAVQAAADSLLEDESSILALATIKDHDEYTFTHSVNVCIFSLAIGQRLGLHRNWLARLGMAALFHDIGKISIPPGVLNKIGVLDVNEWKTIRQHTLTGVRALSRMPACNEHILHSMIVAFQHHLNLDMSGYPKVKADSSMDLFSRIVRIADTFDAMTTERPYRNKVYSPHDAIRYLISQSGSKFDPVLVKAFAGAMGIFPVGTVLRLNTGETGIVIRRSELSGDPDRALIRVVVDGDGTQPADEKFIDLGEVEADTGEFIYSVVDAMSCKDLGLDPRNYLLT